MLTLLILGSLSVLVGGQSPNGVYVMDYLTPGQEAAYTADVLQETIIDVPALVTKHGYPIEQYEVKTSDGYYLKLHRIPSGKTAIPVGSRPKFPVYIEHGIRGSSADFLLLGPQKALGYILADAGYDVWLGNARGNHYSRKHASMKPTSDSFWKFSWHEIGYYDLPASIDFILTKTGKTQVHYVGHSQGTTVFFVMASTKPTYNQKIRSMNSMATEVYLKNSDSVFLKTMSPYIGTANALNLFGSGEYRLSPIIKDPLLKLYCNVNSPTYLLCNSTLNDGIFEFVDPLQVPFYAGQWPAGAATKQYMHFVQLYKSGEFRQYDYGSLQNLIKYGRFSPPPYDLKKVVAPVAVHYALNDAESSKIDVTTLYQTLVKPIGMYQVPRTTFTHLNYFLATDANTQVYNTVIDVINRYDA